MNAYLKPDLKEDFAHFVIRRCILLAVQGFLPHLRGTVVDLGSGNMPYKNLVLGQPDVQRYLAVDWRQTTYYNQKPDLDWDGKTIPLENDAVDCIMMTEVLEHLDDPLSVLRETLRVLKPGGLLVGTTPFVWPLHEVPNDIQRFTPLGLKRLLDAAGFERVQITGAGGWNTTLAQFLCAYVGFHVKGRRRRALAERLLAAPVRWLLRHDKPVTAFRHTDMVNMTIFKAYLPV